MSSKDDKSGSAHASSHAIGKGGTNGVSSLSSDLSGSSESTRDAGLIVARSKQSYIGEIFTLPRDQWEAKLIEYARKEHDEAAGRAREQIRRILESE
jgi:hypothetical protein